MHNFIDKHQAKLSTGSAFVLSFLLTGIALRWYEYLIVSSSIALNDGNLGLHLSAIISDITFYGFWGFVLFLFWLVLQRFSVKAANVVISCLMIAIFLLQTVLVQYFGEVLVLLGVDFWAYNPTEISDTLNTSVDFSFSRIAPLLLFPALFLLILFTLKRLSWNLKSLTASSLFILLTMFGYLLSLSLNDNFETELEHAISTNKSEYFISESIKLWITDPLSNEYSGTEYPLMKAPNTDNVLGPFFRESERLPNLVFVIVEGLGGTVIPPHASYGGFTPFLDSLGSKSLYWTHFLSTSGRSFNAQPSIFGSLPYGKAGFMDLGIQMPDHHTLISILNDNGYQTNYFGGYDTRFDNLDLFLERQRINLLINSSNFPPEYQKMDEIEGGFTWGYADKDLYSRAFEFIDDFDQQQPRLDIFFSLNFHEPFIIQQQEYYQELFDLKLEKLEIPQPKKQEYRQHSELFTALLYTDDAIKQLLNQYQQRDDFENTIFIITGDHRMVPVAHRDRIDRYYVPMIIYSPLLRESRQIKGVSSHLDISPTLLAYLAEDYGLKLPENAHWLGDTLSTSTSFVSNKDIPFMRTKNLLSDFLSGEYYLSDNQLYKLHEGMVIGSVNNDSLKTEIQNEFNEFISLNNYVTSNNKLLKISGASSGEVDQINEELVFLRKHNLTEANTLSLFNTARDSALTENYEFARIILHHLLRKEPNFHDARILLGRTFGWNNDYQKAEEYFNEVLRRNPQVMDAYIALADLYYWREQPRETMKFVNMGLVRDTSFVPLIFRKARTYHLLNETDSAEIWIEKGLAINSDDVNLLGLKEQIPNR